MDMELAIWNCICNNEIKLKMKKKIKKQNVFIKQREQQKSKTSIKSCGDEITINIQNKK